MKVTALQEIKWFGSEVYRVEGSVVLTSGREKPVQGDTAKRSEGVAVVLTDWAIEIWKAAGKQWKAWSSRAVSACLQLGGRSRDKLHIVSCYAPTRAARQEKDTHFDELDSILSSVPAGEKYIVLGDFNARVGSRQVEVTSGVVRGPHGCGVTNDAGKELLDFLSTQQATVYNRWYRKEIYRVTSATSQVKAVGLYILCNYERV